MPPTPRAIIVLFAFFTFLGCGGARESDDTGAPLQRHEIARAFTTADEPLVTRLDLSTDERSPLAVTFGPQGEDVPEPPFEVYVFKSLEAAERQARSIAMVAVEGTDFIVWKNAILTLAPSLPAERRERLIDALRSL